MYCILYCIGLSRVFKLTYSFYTILRVATQLFLVVVTNSSILQFFNYQVFVFEINMPEGTEIALLANIMTSSFLEMSY